ncbi:MAG: S-adenosylmethionine synthase [Patescibacteria group bacterium]|nr:MAG: S-adenosylmethionine synthase [Patescibacteria group bacterium]
MSQVSFFTSESVCAGHPDKICDQISDAILDAVLERDPFGRVAVETLVTANNVVLAGEVTTSTMINFEDIARKQIATMGYTNPEFGFSDTSNVTVLIHKQSPEIALGVDEAGAGDQGMMFGFACTDTAEYMPLPIMMSHTLARKIDELRETKKVSYLRPDGKTQTTVRYEDGKPVSIEKVVIAVPHDPAIKLSQVKKDIYEFVINPVLKEFGFIIPVSRVIVNGTGAWYIGGPASDTGVTGRKIVVDGYGGFARVGGGAFSGKDPTKVDRSAAYAARFLAKNIVANRFAERVEVGLAYCIGKAQPVMKSINTFGTENRSMKEIESYVSQLLDCSVLGIIRGLDLRKPVYLDTASYGHFGRQKFSWEQIVL